MDRMPLANRTHTMFATTLLMVATLVACSGGGDQPGSAAGETPQVAAADGSSGERLYMLCATCHQANGLGLPGTFPPLAASEYATAANPAAPIQVVLRGMTGALTVKGVEYNGFMPPYGTGAELDDEDVAAVLTYVRSSWGNSASPITPEQVAKERAAVAGKGAITAQELQALMSAP